MGEFPQFTPIQQPGKIEALPPSSIAFLMSFITFSRIIVNINFIHVLTCI
jgi:hypothetical protein